VTWRKHQFSYESVLRERGSYGQIIWGWVVRGREEGGRRALVSLPLFGGCHGVRE